MKKFRILFMVGFMMFMAIMGYVLHDSGMIVERPKFSLVDAFTNESVNNEDLKGKTYAVNIFSSYCLACIEEMPAIKSLSKKMPVYGIAYMDSKESLENFVEKHGNPYSLLAGDFSGQIVAKSFRVSAVPITLIVNGTGKVVFRHDGELTQDMIEKHILRNLE